MTRAPSGENADADEDYGAALRHLAETVPGSLAACGYSFGSAAAVRAAAGQSRVTRLVLVAPPPALVDAEALAAFSGPVLVLLGENDAFAPLGEVEAMLAPVRRAELVTIPDADHFFAVGLGAIQRFAVPWLEKTA